ncbi:MAG: helix-turn-helix transcriptional regulator, partial [Ruminococcaceae bacterium]|nr:helix-turn-helix transcriptional regulator [Oscillospiraceae bacterium]
MKEYIAVRGLGRIRNVSLFNIRYPSGHCYTVHPSHAAPTDILIIMLEGQVSCQVAGWGELTLAPNTVTYFSRGIDRTSRYLTDTRLLSVHIESKSAVFPKAVGQLPMESLDAHSRACLELLIAGVAENQPIGDFAVASCIYGLLDSCAAAEPPEIPSRYAAVHAAKLAIDSDFTSERSIPEYARDAAMSESSFRRLFAEYTGTPPARYRQKLRLEYVKLLVQSGECNLSEAASRAGYNSLPYLCRQ